MQADKLFDDIVQFVKESRGLLESGAIMELQGLDTRVHMLCEQVLQLSQEERVTHSARLQGLLKELTSLGESLARARDALGEEATQMTQHKKANTAYRTTEAIDNYGKRDDD